MSDEVVIRAVDRPGDLDAVRHLLRAYAASLPVDLSYQGFEEELAALPGGYALPEGGLWLARFRSGAPVACVGLRPLPDGACEMKRLFVLPAARGRKLGERLASLVIAEARERGYLDLRLDTLPTMLAALSLYGRLGFRRTEAYYAPTPAGTVFLALSLAPGSAFMIG